MLTRPGLWSLVIIWGAFVSFATAATVWDEGFDGDLSTNAAAPTAVGFAPGSNIVTGTVTSSGTPADTRDYLTFDVPAGYGLFELRLLQWDDVPGGGPGNTGFNAINAGSTSFVPGGGTIGSFLGSNHVDAFYVGLDMLADISAPATGGTGFTVPLGAGTYSYVVQQTGTQIDAYSLNFRILPIPEPTTLALGCLGIFALGRRRRE
jgi:hypothetical protein